MRRVAGISYMRRWRRHIPILAARIWIGRYPEPPEVVDGDAWTVIGVRAGEASTEAQPVQALKRKERSELRVFARESRDGQQTGADPIVAGFQGLDKAAPALCPQEVKFVAGACLIVHPFMLWRRVVAKRDVA
jgi:hypothetical protein